MTGLAFCSLRLWKERKQAERHELSIILLEKTYLLIFAFMVHVVTLFSVDTASQLKRISTTGFYLQEVLSLLLTSEHKINL